jgi:ABC-type transport system involved in cytochrome c biogenesis permease subunit
MMLALVFDSLMLIAGAVWAQDAWGRYWAWDPLETSAFLTWLFLAIGLHVRLSYRVPPIVSGLMIIGIFMMAFATYFGTPYISPAAHKGMV